MKHIGSRLDFVIVSATIGDCEVVTRHRYFQQDVTDEARGHYSTWLASALASNRYKGWLALLGGADPRQIVGGCGLTLLDWGPTRNDPSPLRARVVNMFVESSYRRMGVARALLGFAIEHARTLNIRTVSLGASDMSRPLYESVGFRPGSAEMLLDLFPRDSAA